MLNKKDSELYIASPNVSSTSKKKDLDPRRTVRGRRRKSLPNSKITWWLNGSLVEDQRLCAAATEEEESEKATSKKQRRKRRRGGKQRKEKGGDHSMDSMASSAPSLVEEKKKKDESQRSAPVYMHSQASSAQADSDLKQHGSAQQEVKRMCQQRNANNSKQDQHLDYSDK